MSGTNFVLPSASAVMTLTSAVAFEPSARLRLVAARPGQAHRKHFGRYEGKAHSIKIFLLG
jgi:hypothetical protein